MKTLIPQPILRAGTWLCLFLALGLLPPPVSGQHILHGNEQKAVPLYDNLGSYSRNIGTKSVEAQAFFNQGLRLEYAFNHAEAIRSYERALELDPSCAACWWGIALASGPNINGAMDEEGGLRAYGAIQKATKLSKDTNRVDRAFIKALSTRYGRAPLADRATLDSAYAGAMNDLAAQFPDDGDVLTLYAAALMNLRPWNYWSGEYDDRKPNPGTEQILSSLERALQLNPNNPGACHYYIHAVEAAFPKKAIDCAERLVTAMPGAGHLVHMPGHIYIRVGRYKDAVTLNEHAVHSDESFIADQNPVGAYPSAYYPHNYHFMAFAATMAGMSEKAIQASIVLAPKVPIEVAKDFYWLQNAVVFPQLTYVTFGKWNEVLAMPLPNNDLVQSVVLTHYARGVAHAALGHWGEADNELAIMRKTTAERDRAGENLALKIADHALSGEIAFRSGDFVTAVREFKTAADIEDTLLYEEPPLWYYPIRHSLGKALLEAGMPSEAEAAYRKDLTRFPDNGWSLIGLANSLTAQGRLEEAQTVQAQFAEAWKHADVKLDSSRF